MILFSDRFKAPEASASQAGTITTTAQTFAGEKTFSETIVGDISGNAATVTNGVYTAGNQVLTGNIEVGDSTNKSVDLTPTVSNNHLVVSGAGYTGFITLDGTKMSIGHNSGSRNFSISTQGTDRISCSGPTTTISGELKVEGTGTVPIRWAATGGSGLGTEGQLAVRVATSGRNRPFIFLQNTDSSRTYFFGNDEVLRQGFTSSISQTGGGDGGVIVGTQTSDIRLKSNIVSCPYGLDTVMQLNPVEYDKQTGSLTKHEIGFAAQEVVSLVPEAVYDTNEDIDGTENTKLAMEYTQLIPVLTKAIQELKTALDTANARIDTLENP